MSMHMEGPWLSMGGKKKGKVKYKSAEAKRQAEQLAKDWEALKEKHNANVGKSRRVDNVWTYSLSVPPGRSTSSAYRSVDSGVGVAAKAPVKVYTGTKMLGVSQMSKSNAVPVFNTEHVLEIARMRR